MTNLDRLLNTLFSRMKGQEGNNNAGFVFYWLDNGNKAVIVRQHGTQSLYKPKQALPPKTSVFVEAVLSSDGKELVLEYKVNKPNGITESESCLIYSLVDLRLAAHHAVHYLICGAVPQPTPEVLEEQF